MGKLLKYSWSESLENVFLVNATNMKENTVVAFGRAPGVAFFNTLAAIFKPLAP